MQQQPKTTLEKQMFPLLQIHALCPELWVVSLGTSGITKYVQLTKARPLSLRNV